MDQNVKVTIAIPIYNAERFLYLAIESVLAQTFSDFELILTDDGSTDNSLEIIRSFNDPRIILITDGRNRGISFRLNQQIALAKGKYFVRMDADDIMFPDRVMKQYNFLEEYEEIDLIGCPVLVIDDENSVIGKRETLIPIGIRNAFKHSIFIHPTVMGKTSWFKKYGYLESLKGAEDFDLWLRSFNDSTFALFDVPLLYYRDPLKIKMNTYHFRQVQYRRCIWQNRKLLNDRLFLSELIILSFFKEFIYRVACILNLDSELLKLRN
jgi:glycosyltransferase involved in cell wall biosynthesis